MTTPPVVVVGGGLAGLAAAARLAKAGHSVELYEQRPQLGGRWAAYELSAGGILVDDAPGVLRFPAPWRDLFRKSGRPLEAELARSGHALVSAEPLRLVFADHTPFTLPTDRGEQFAAMTDAYGRTVAQRWRDLVDRLDDVWQVLRPLGLELELRPDRLTKSVRRSLLAHRSLADLAATAGHPHLTALVRSVAYQQGSTPERTPAFVAVELSILRTFGRWHVETTANSPERSAGRTSVLVDALVARLALRKVTVHLGHRVEGIVVRDGRAAGVTTPQGESAAAAVISTVDPWTLQSLLPPGRARLAVSGRPGWRRPRPALAPAVTHRLVTAPAPRMIEKMTLSADGVPQISYLRPVGERSVSSVHDFGSAVAAPGAGLAWRGFASWRDRPPVTAAIPGLFSAGPFSAAGPGPSQTILSGALASYASHDLLEPSPPTG
jgi:phytoene dehydrogenase-like protein